MHKEVVLAILLGLGLGLVITYGVYRSRTAPTATQNEVITSTDPTASDSDSKITIFSPENESVQSTQSVTVTGSTDPGSFVVILVGEVDFITTADESGNFSIEAELKEGSNIIQAHAVNEDGEVSITEHVVIYNTDPLVESETESASPSADTMNEEK